MSSTNHFVLNNTQKSKCSQEFSILRFCMDPMITLSLVSFFSDSFSMAYGLILNECIEIDQKPYNLNARWS